MPSMLRCGRPNIFRKAGVSAEDALGAVAKLDLGEMLAGDEGTSVWEVWLTASRLSLVLEQAIATAEPAMLARYAFVLAQQFNNFYHRHHILNETDEVRKTLLLATAAGGPAGAGAGARLAGNYCAERDVGESHRVRQFLHYPGVEGSEADAMAILTVTERGQVTFRKEVLEHLGIRKGDKIELKMLPGGRAALEAARPMGSITGLSRMSGGQDYRGRDH